MFLFHRRPPQDYEDSFVRDVDVVRRRPVNPRTRTLLRWMWALIALKSVFVWWACDHYPVPLHPLWIVGPTVLFGILVTAVFYARR